ncbi:MAG: hypothetical protein ABW007_12830 [Chitinophagaceae bacterium]
MLYPNKFTGLKADTLPSYLSSVINAKDVDAGIRLYRTVAQ